MKHGLTVHALTVKSVERELYFFNGSKEAQPTKADWAAIKLPLEEAICTYRSPFQLLF